MGSLKVLLGGLPLGCNNIGIEAIVECVIAILRRLHPDIDITVSTRNETGCATRLNVHTIPLYGFKPAPKLRTLSKIIRNYDLLIWCGANGLSDYPDSALNLLLCAQKQGVQTLLWGLGMDSDLNPYQPRAYRNIIERLLDAFNHICNLDIAAPFAQYRQRRLQKKIYNVLENSLLVVVRDPETAELLKYCGFTRSIVGADSTLHLEAANESPVQREKGIFKIGFSLSSRKPIADFAGLRALWRRLIENPAQRLVLIPMDSYADFKLMDGLRRQLPHQDRIQMLACTEPSIIQAAAANCDVVVSSRLILLILAANVFTPIIGIESGSKIHNWLRIFELKPVGTVANCNFERVEEAIAGFQVDGGAAFRKKAAFVYNLMRKRLALAEEELKSTLQKLSER
ncbi:MAG: polysaccharide pyruvyl transferase family protein [Lentisphaerae bacterium]|nr:polysaccharide pyruvyl transferase family protein [Lentisphaerota bacterium]